ncbi:MAG: TraB family protein, partial [Candidatus Diapherotrites archaeon]
AMGLREKLNLLISIFAGFFGNAKDELTADKIEELKKKDMMSELMQQLSREMPNVKHVLVDERDMYIANKILAAPGQKVVAVVGAGHIGGIMHYLDKPRGVQHLELLPAKKGGAMKYMKYLVPVIFFSIIAYALLTKGAAASLDMFILWFLINGTLSALGVLLARGHPFTIIAAFLAAPFTSLHPMIAAGWIAGAVEAKVRNPKVKDFEGLRNLNSYRDFSRNQVTRILLVVAYANLGSTLGTLIALPYIVSLLA